MSYPSFETEPVLLWENGAAQAFVSLGIGRNDPVPCYFSLTADLPYGNLAIQKTTNTGQNKDGWVFDIYSGKSASGNPVKTVTSGTDGKITAIDLTPGWYTVSERAKDGWLCDTPKTVEVKAGETASVSFSNTQLGKAEIVKAFATMEPNGTNPLSGWQFTLKSEADGSVCGPYTTGNDGKVTTGWLKPGWYTVTEIIPEGSLYTAKTNPQRIEIKSGTTVQTSITFTNALKPARISIHKVDPSGNPLAGAKFLLEWSSDNGATWKPVAKNSGEDVAIGGCSSSVVDGCLITDDSGIISFEGLHPQLLYRLTEVEAPAGYLLLSDRAWQGRLDTQTNLSLELTVHNSPGFLLPNTGTADAAYVICGAFFAALAAGILAAMTAKTDFFFRRKTK